MTFRAKLQLAAGVGLVLLNRALLRVGLRRRVEGWRHAAGLLLRGEAATFVLSAFNLDVWSDVATPPPFSVESTTQHLAERLEVFLAGEPSVHIRMRTNSIQLRCEPAGAASYTLGFEQWVDGPARFIRPESWTPTVSQQREFPPEEALLNIICRVHPEGGVDLWMRANHAGIDGVPVQEVLSRLEAAWHRRGPVIFPTPEAFAAYQGPRSCAGRAGLLEMQDFIDFSPLLKWRSKTNATLPAPLTVSAALMWCLARNKAFDGLCMGTTVEVPAKDGLASGVGIVVVKPADYFGKNTGLTDYARDFNRQLELTRKRTSDGCKTLDAAAFIPLKMEAALLHRALEQGGRAFGSLGLTILRDASVFGAPMSDHGYADGFIAIGSIALDAGNGRRVGCVTVKGPPQRISIYPKLLREIISSCQNE